MRMKRRVVARTTNSRLVRRAAMRPGRHSPIAGDWRVVFTLPAPTRATQGDWYDFMASWRRTSRCRDRRRSS